MIIRFFSLFCLCIFIGSFAQIKWMTIDEMLTAQQTEPKKILILFYSKDKSPQSFIDNKTMENSVITNYISKYFYAVKFDIENHERITYMGQTFEGATTKQSPHSFAKFMNISTIPSFVFVSENLELIIAINGMINAKELEPYLAVISSDKYLKFKSSIEWSEYHNKFKGKIKK